MKVKELQEQLTKLDPELEVIIYLEYEEDASPVRRGAKVLEADDTPYVKGDFPEIQGDKFVLIS